MCAYNLCFEEKYEKYQNFLSVNFQYLVVKFSIYLNRRVFVMIFEQNAFVEMIRANVMKVYQKYANW